MKRLSLLLLLLLTIAACAVPVDDEFGVDPPAVTESYLLLQIHRNFAERMGNVWSQAWAWCGGVTEVDSSKWTADKTISVNFAAGGDSHKMSMHFHDLGYDPDLSSITYGQPKSVTEEGSLEDHSYIYDLSGVAQDGHFSQTDSVELQRSRSVEITHGVTMDVTVQSETKVSGEYAGVGLEQTITASFGYTDTEEQKRAESESTAQATSHTFDVPLPAGAVTRIGLNVGNTSSSRTVNIDGVATWSTTFTLGAPCIEPGPTFAKWWNTTARYIVSPNNAQISQCGPIPPGVSDTPTKGPANTFSGHTSADIAGWLGGWEGCQVTIPLAEMEAVWYGRDAAWQGLAGWLDHQGQSRATQIDTALDSDSRTVHVSGVQQTTSQADLITTATQISQDAIGTALSSGAKLCVAGTSTC
ncbi:MAG: hypothetical protein OXM88_02660 [bacterium]|nr:hypothetical protein [bacterium]